ncbi:MAG: YDG domain-containing protein, partial [Bacteroidota bacterium]
MNRGSARLDSISLNRGGQGFRLMVGLRLGLDSFSAVSDTFNLEKPIAHLLGDFQMTTKKYDGNTLGAIFSQTWFVRPLPVGGDSLVIQPIEARFRSPSVGDRKKAVLWNYQIAGNASAEYEYSYRINGTGVVTEGKLGGSESSMGYCPTICRHLDWSPIDSGRIVCLGMPTAQQRAGEMFRFKAELQTNRGKWAEHIDTVSLNVQMTQGPSGWQGYELPHAALLIRGQYSSGFWSVSRSGSYRLQLAPGTDQRWRATESSFSVQKPLSVISGIFNGQNRVWNGNKSVVVTDFSSLQASRLTFTQDELTIQSVTAEFLSSATGLNKRIRPTALVLGGRDAVHYDVVAGSSVQGRAHIFSPSALGGQSTTTIGFAQKVGSFLGDSSIGVMFLSTRSSNYSSLPCGDEILDLEISV